MSNGKGDKDRSTFTKAYQKNFKEIRNRGVNKPSIKKKGVTIYKY